MLNSPLLPNAARALKGGASIAKPRTNGEEEQKRKRRRPASLVPELGLGGLAVPSTEQEGPGLPQVLPSVLPPLPSLVPVATEERAGPLSAPDLRPSLASLAPEQLTSSILAPEAERSSPNAKGESPATARITAAPPAMEVSGPGLNSTEDNVEASHSEAFSARLTSIGQEAKDPATGSRAESDKGETSESRETPAPVSTSVGVIAPPVAAVPATSIVHASDASQPAQALSAAPKAVAVEGPESKPEAEPQPEASNELAFLGNLAAAGSVQQGAVAVPAEHRASEQPLPDTARGGNVAAVSQQFGMTAGFLSQSAGTQVGVTSENGAKRVDSADSRFTGLTQAPASEIVRGISGDFVEELGDEFDQVRSTRETRAPVLRVELPGDPPAIERQDASLPLQLPTADRIRTPEGGDGDGLTAEETSVPLQPEGDSVQADTGTSPQIRLTGSAAPDHARAASGDAANLGVEICSQTTADLHQSAAAKKIHRTGLLREDSVEIADSRQTASISASTEMLEYLETDVPAGVRRQADRDLAPSLNEALSAPRQKAQEATEDRETQVDQAFEEAVAETDAAGQDANDRQQQAISDGYAQVAAEKQAGLEEAREAQASFDVEVKQRHRAHQGEVRAKVETEQQKADDAIHNGEEDARKEIEDAREKEREARESAEREKPKQKKKKWYEKVGDWFKNAIKEWTDKLVDAIKTVFNHAKQSVSRILTAAKNLAVGIIRSVKKFVVAAVRTFTAGLKLLVNGLLVAFPKLRARVNQAIDQVVNATVSAIETIAQKLDAAVTAAVDRVQSTVNRVLDFCELVIVTQVQIAGALLSGEFLDAARILFLAACKAIGIPGEELLGILADARGALIDIIKRPAKFLGYLLRSVGQGMKTFFSHFPKRMVAGLTGWLFGQVAQGAVNLPKSFDLKSIFGLLIQVMGFTYDYIRGKVVALVGEKAISVIEQVMAPIRILFTEGPGALWNWLADKAKEAKDAIVEAASQWFVTQIITQAAIKLATMFTPVGAFVQAVLMMYNTVMFFVEKIKEIFAWVKSITSSLQTIAVGAISSAADYIDQSMSKTIPLIIAFLARLLGIGGIGDKIRQVVTKLRTPIDKAIMFVVHNLIKLAKAAWGGIKKGATAVKGSMVGWWNAEESFITRDGQRHRLFFEGEGKSAVLMVASDKKTVDASLEEMKKQQAVEQNQLNAIETKKATLDTTTATEESGNSNQKVAQVSGRVRSIADSFAELHTLDAATAKEILPCAKDGPTASKLAAAAIDDFLKLSPEKFQERYGASAQQYGAFIRAYENAKSHQMFATQPERPDYDIIDSNGVVMKYSEFERRALIAKLDVARAPFAAVGYVVASAFTDDENKRMAAAGLAEALGGIADGVGGVATSRQINSTQSFVPRGTIKTMPTRTPSGEEEALSAVVPPVAKRPPSQAVDGRIFHEKQQAVLSKQLKADSEVTFLSPNGQRSRVDSLLRIKNEDRYEYISISLKRRNWNRLLNTLDRNSHTAKLEDLKTQVRVDVKELIDKYSGIREVRSYKADQVSHGEVIEIVDVVLTYNSKMLGGVVRSDLIEAWATQAFDELRVKHPELKTFTITFESVEN